MKSSKVSIKTRSTPASLTFKGQATKHTTVKWSIRCVLISISVPKSIRLLAFGGPGHSFFFRCCVIVIKINPIGVVSF